MAFLINALVLDKDGTRRARLKDAARAVVVFDDVITLSTPEEVLLRLGRESKWDVVIFTQDSLATDFSEFLRLARETQFGKEAAYVLVMKGSSQDSSQIATTFGSGIDGFLFEPFSADGLKDSAMIALRIKVHAGSARLKIALTFFISTVLTNLPVGRTLDLQAMPEFRNLKEVCLKLKEMCTESGQSFTQIVEDMYEELTPNKGEYQGHSQRVKERFLAEVKFREQLKTELLSL